MGTQLPYRKKRNHLPTYTRRYFLILLASLLWAAPSRAAPRSPISEDGFVPIGGIDQWVSIRGCDRSRTALLFLHGGPFSIPRLLPTLLAFDARAAGYEMPVPFFVIQGRDDNVAPPAAASDAVEQVRATAKGFTAIEGGHFACFTNPRGFLDALRRVVDQALKT